MGYGRLRARRDRWHGPGCDGAGVYGWREPVTLERLVVILDRLVVILDRLGMIPEVEL